MRAGGPYEGAAPASGRRDRGELRRQTARRPPLSHFIRPPSALLPPASPIGGPQPRSPFVKVLREGFAKIFPRSPNGQEGGFKPAKLKGAIGPMALWECFGDRRWEARPVDMAARHCEDPAPGFHWHPRGLALQPIVAAIESQNADLHELQELRELREPIAPIRLQEPIAPTDRVRGLAGSAAHPANALPTLRTFDMLAVKSGLGLGARRRLRRRSRQCGFAIELAPGVRWCCPSRQRSLPRGNSGGSGLLAASSPALPVFSSSDRPFCNGPPRQP